MCDFLGVARERVEALVGRREICAVFLQPNAGAVDERLQVEARFAIERGEELVEVDVRGGLLDRDHGAAVEPFRRRAARIDLDGEVLELRLRAHQQRGVAVDARVLRRQPHRHDRPAFLDRDAFDFADLGAGDRDRLSLPGGERLRRFEVRLQREVALPDEWKAAGKGQALIGEHVAADQDRSDDHHDHRDERAAVAADLVADAADCVLLCGGAVHAIRAVARGRGAARWRARCAGQCSSAPRPLGRWRAAR